jgi:diketogulonate reductase-like aldo/keto reductase
MFKHSNFPYHLTKDYNEIFNFLLTNQKYYLIGFSDFSPFHLFKMRRLIDSCNEIAITDNQMVLKVVNNAEKFEDVCKELKLVIILPEIKS